MHTETLIGITASLCTALSLVPQLIKICKEKKAESVSVGMLLVLFLGLGLWVYYGILLLAWIIILSNSFSLLINVMLTMFALKFKETQ